MHPHPASLGRVIKTTALVCASVKLHWIALARFAANCARLFSEEAQALEKGKRTQRRLPIPCALTLSCSPSMRKEVRQDKLLATAPAHSSTLSPCHFCAYLFLWQNCFILLNQQFTLFYIQLLVPFNFLSFLTCKFAAKKNSFTYWKTILTR